MKTLSCEIKNLETMELASIHHKGPYAGDTALFERLFNQLMGWAGQKNLLQFPETKVLAVYHNDPTVLPEEEHEMSVCITVPKETEEAGDIKRTQTDSGKYAVIRYELLQDEYCKAWTDVFEKQIPQAKAEIREGECLELYLNNPDEHPENLHLVDICIPVK